MSRILLAAGGTGGHVYPALALADVLRARGHEVVFAGGGRLEARAVPEAGYRLVRLPARGLPRRLSAEALRAAAEAVRAVDAARRAIRALGVEAVVGMGGYASFGPAVAAGLCGVPLVLHEQNARLSLAHRLPVRWARALATSLPLEDRVPGGVRVVRTGSPIREPIRRLALAGPEERGRRRAAARRRFGLEEGRTTVLVMGGSLGARVLNEAVPQLPWGGREVQVLHLAGEGQAGEVRGRWAGRGVPAVVLGFCAEIEEAYAAADLVVGRAGGAAMAELCAVGLASVLVPFPLLRRGDQEANARVLERGGAAAVVSEAGGGFVGRLAEAVLPLVDDRRRREAMAAAARALGQPDAAEQLAGLVEEACLPPR